MPDVDLTVQLGPLTLKNPVMPASGTFEYSEEQRELFDLARLGAMVAKSVTLKRRPGNPAPRLHEVTAGLLNAVGIPSEGIHHFIEVTLPALAQIDTALIVSIAGDSVEEFATVARMLDPYRGQVSALELNLSCPNLTHGVPFATDEKLMRATVEAVRESTTLPIIAKLSPNVTDIVKMAGIAREAGADIISMINTLIGMAIDVETRRPVLGNVVGGLSGPAIKPVALRMIWETSQSVDIPIIGMGGISNARDAIEFMLAGASAVAVGVASFRNPLVMLEIVNGIESYLAGHGFGSPKEIVGLAWKERMV